jgi:hypothetical protein
MLMMTLMIYIIIWWHANSDVLDTVWAMLSNDRSQRMNRAVKVCGWGESGNNPLDAWHNPQQEKPTVMKPGGRRNQTALADQSATGKACSMAEVAFLFPTSADSATSVECGFLPS